MKEISFLKNWLGNNDAYGNYHYSFKKFGLVIATFTAYLTPTFLLLFGFKDMTCELWLSFYKVVFPSTAALYAGGKWIDGKNGNNNGNSKEPEPQTVDEPGSDA